MNREQAELIAVQALQFVAGDEDRMGRFLALTGLGPQDIRGRVSDPAFLGGVLDFLLNFEPDLLEFAEQAGVAPSVPLQARQALPGAVLEI